MAHVEFRINDANRQYPPRAAAACADHVLPLVFDVIERLAIIILSYINSSRDTRVFALKTVQNVFSLKYRQKRIDFRMTVLIL